MTNEEAIELLCAYGVPLDENKFREALDMAIKALSAEKTAEWIFKTTKSAQCSNCGHIQFTNGEDTTKKTLIHNALYHYCPNCGAKMKKESEEE